MLREGRGGLTGQEPLPAHRLAGVHKRDAPYSSRRGPRATRGFRKPSLDDAHWETRQATPWGVERESGGSIRFRRALGRASFDARSWERSHATT